MRSKIALAILAVLAILVAFGLEWPPKANAAADSLGEMQGGVTGTQVACATSATAIQPSTVIGRRAKKIWVQNNSATAVFLGGSSVADTKGIELCTSCAAGELFAYEGAKLWCVVNTGTVTVNVAWAD